MPEPKEGIFPGFPLATAIGESTHGNVAALVTDSTCKETGTQLPVESMSHVRDRNRRIDTWQYRRLGYRQRLQGNRNTTAGGVDVTRPRPQSANRHMAISPPWLQTASARKPEHNCRWSRCHTSATAIGESTRGNVAALVTDSACKETGTQLPVESMSHVRDRNRRESTRGNIAALVADSVCKETGTQLPVESMSHVRDRNLRIDTRQCRRLGYRQRLQGNRNERVERFHVK